MQNSFKQINEIIDNLLVICNENCQLPKIEKDILLEKLRKLYLQSQTIEELEIPVKLEEEEPEYEVHKGMEDDVDLFFDTDHESYGAPDTAEEPIEEPAPEPEPIPEPTPEPVKIPVPEPVKEPEPVAKPVEPSPEPQPKPQAELKLELEPEVVKPKVTPTQPSKVAQKPEQVIEPEQLNDETEDDLLQFIPQKSAPKAAPRSLNDLFNKQQEDRSLGGQFQHAKVGDLTKAISINDKFTFIKELFNNKGEEFSAAIQQLNQCSSMDEAFDCLENLKKKYFWDSTATAYLSLCDLLRRKYN